VKYSGSVIYVYGNENAKFVENGYKTKTKIFTSEIDILHPRSMQLILHRVWNVSSWYRRIQ